MELKQRTDRDNSEKRIVLIVPYGIETLFPGKLNGIPESVLIVPYGIETFIELFFLLKSDSVNCTLWN